MTPSDRDAPKQLRVLYEDNHLLGVFKDGGVLVQGDKTGDITLLHIAKRYIKRTYNKPGEVFLGLVHRIDRPVSGVVMFARTSKAASRLANAFRTRQVSKRYLAIVRGNVQNDEGELVAHVERVRLKTKVVRPDPDRRSVKEAVLRYRVISRKSGCTLLVVEPITGRHHQIRVQLSHAGHPIVGDLKYGDSSPLPDRTIALHAYYLSLKHPTKDEQVELRALPPATDVWQPFAAIIENRFRSGG